MSEEPQNEESLSDEFRNLGKNLMDVLNKAWESSERKHLQQEIESGLSELGGTMKREADNFTSSPAGQQFKSDVEDLGERIRSGEAQAKARQELFSILRTANTELQKVIDKWSMPQPEAETNAPTSEGSEK